VPEHLGGGDLSVPLGSEKILKIERKEIYQILTVKIRSLILLVKIIPNGLN
jgi:hypothetical protein